MDPDRSRLRLITLGGPQFAMLVVGLGTITVVLALALVWDVSEALCRIEARQYEQKLGFELGLVKGFPMGPPDGLWGVVGVTAGSRMDKAGMRSGDVVFSRHGHGLTELSWAIRESARGRTACVFVANAEEARTGSRREVCLN